MMRLSLLVLLLAKCFFLSAQEKDTTISLYFENNKSQLDQSQENYLQTISSTVRCIDEMIGYADTVASAEYNLQLSKKRVEYILSILKSANFCQQYKVSYKGETKQFGKDLQENRRVDIKLKIFYEPAKPANSKSDSAIVTSWNIYTIQFLPDSHYMTAESADYIDELYRQLSRYKTERFQIIGHVNYQSKKSAEQLKDMYQLSEYRAKAIADILIEKGIPASRIEYKGVGNSQPLFPKPVNDDERRKNMRVEIKVLKL